MVMRTSGYIEKYAVFLIVLLSSASSLYILFGVFSYLFPPLDFLFNRFVYFGGVTLAYVISINLIKYVPSKKVALMIYFPFLLIILWGYLDLTLVSIYRN